MNKKTLTLALVAATIAVTYAQLFAGNRVESAEVSPTQLDSSLICP